MKFYKLRFNRREHLVFDISPNDIEATLGDMFILDDAEKWDAFWKPINGVFSDDSENGNVTSVPDISLWFTDEIVCNEKAFQILKQPLEAYGEWLSILVEGISYWLLHVTQKTGMECVDLKNSARTIDAIDNIEIQKLAFNKDPLENTLIFKTAYNDYQNIYCSENFKMLIEDAGLHGLIFSSDMSNSPH